MNSAPPLAGLAARLVRRGSAGPEAEFVLGDLHEDHRQVCRERGRLLAGLWYWRQVTTTALSRPDPLDIPERKDSHMFEHVLRDVSAALRSIRQRPAFSGIVILTLGVGIGATTAIFSLVNAVSLRALPYPDADQLVLVRETLDNDQARPVPTSYPTFVDWSEADSFADIALFSPFNTMILVGPEETLRLRANLASSGYFELIGLQPGLGRLYGPEADDTTSIANVTVISHGLWERRFGGREDVIGELISLNGNSYTIVGVGAEDYVDLYAGGAPTDLWVPITALNQLGSPGALTRRVVRQFQALARLDAGVSVEAAQQELDGIAGAIQEAHADVMATQGANVTALRRQLVGQATTSLATLMVGSGFLLLMGCINVASLMLFRGTSRAREIAIRLAMGASRRRLIRLLVTESLVLATGGGILGVFLAEAGIRALLSSNIVPLPPYIAVNIDVTVLAITALLIAASGVAVGLLPALRSTGRDIGTVLTDSDLRSAGRSNRRPTNLLVVAEVTVAVVLLVGSGLVLRSFQYLNGVDLGFRTERIMSVQVNLPRVGYGTEESVYEFRNRLTERLGGSSAAQFAATWGPGLPGQATSYTTAVPDGKVVESQLEADLSRMHGVTPGALESLEIPLLAGRLLNADDTVGSQRVAVISENLAETLWPGEEALGRVFNHVVPNDRDPAEYPPYEVVGVVADASLGGRLIGNFGVPALNDIYVPYEHLFLRNNLSSFAVLVGTGGDPAGATDLIRAAVREIDPNVPIFSPLDLVTAASAELVLARFIALLMSIFGSVSLLLAAIGIYGILSQSVATRTREIGVRIALGARASTTAWLIVGHGMKLAAAGVVLGLGVAYVLAQSISSLLFGVAPTDPVTLVGSALILGAVAMLASYVPTRRALRVDPADSLRVD
ncbi:MAG: FtsX-like permease family protein [Acidobacteria bacterium]|nr:FtsX-like permease family protein [Acidobacteriota bacterium]